MWSCLCRLGWSYSIFRIIWRRPSDFWIILYTIPYNKFGGGGGGGVQNPFHVTPGRALTSLQMKCSYLLSGLFQLSNQSRETTGDVILLIFELSIAGILKGLAPWIPCIARGVLQARKTSTHKHTHDMWLQRCACRASVRVPHRSIIWAALRHLRVACVDAWGICRWCAVWSSS